VHTNGLLVWDQFDLGLDDAHYLFGEEAAK
jgi:hypothetical protein